MRRRNRKAARLPISISLFLLVVLFFVSLSANLLATHNPLTQNVSERLHPPDLRHLMGTDGFGRDVFSRVLVALRVSLLLSVSSVAVSAIAGVLIGGASAYFGGWFDMTIQRVVDVLLGFPSIVLALIVVVGLNTSISALFVAMSIAFFPMIVRIARVAALSTKTETYIAAAQVNNLRPIAILLRHLLPNSLSPIIAQVSSYFGVAMVTEATLSFLGLGVPPPYPSLGNMLKEGASQFLETAPWISFFPGFVLLVVSVSFALLGDSLRDLLDPKNNHGSP